MPLLALSLPCSPRLSIWTGSIFVGNTVTGRDWDVFAERELAGVKRDFDDFYILTKNPCCRPRFFPKCVIRSS